MGSYASSSRTVLYHCPCTSSTPLPPSSASSFYAFHPLESLYFCEECDAVRCPDCIASEISSYYCPNCLFDVPTANVRAEKNRCARNCFQCPTCQHSLLVLASDNTVTSVPPTAPEASIGVPPYFLYCSACKWTSSEIGMQFDKATGLAHQLQKIEDQAADLLEFDHLKSHFDTYLANTASISSQPPTSVRSTTKFKPTPTHHISNITAAASHALQRDVPGLAKVKVRPRASMAATPAKRMTVSDEMEEYKVLEDWSGVGLVDGFGKGDGPGEEERLVLMREMRDGDAVAPLLNRLDQSWAQSPAASAQAPTRIPLISKPTKRCPDCRHILIQPDSKAASVRYKIKLVASNYLPLIEVGNRRLRGRGGGTRMESLDEGLEPGRGYLFQLAFTNPLYDPITTRLALARPPPNAPQVHLPTSSFPISALKDAWAYEGEEDDDPTLSVFDEASTGTLGRAAGSRMSIGGRKATVERHENVSKVGLEVLIPQDCKESRLEVAYTYRSDDAADKQEKSKGEGEYKTFTYWVRVDLGEIYPPLTEPVKGGDDA